MYRSLRRGDRVKVVFGRDNGSKNVLASDQDFDTKYGLDTKLWISYTVQYMHYFASGSSLGRLQRATGEQLDSLE